MADRPQGRPTNGEIAVRYVLLGVLVRAGLSVLLLNQLFRIGVTGDSERDDEEAARDYHRKHGRWPDEDRSEDVDA